MRYTILNAPPDCYHCLASNRFFCSQLDSADFEELRAMAVGVCFRRGEVIFEQDEDLAHIFVITRGLVRLYRLTSDGQRQITGFLGSGDLLGGIKRNAGAYCTAEAITEMEACGFDRKSFVPFLHDHPDLCLAFLVAATDEIEAQYVHHSVEEDGHTVHIPMARADIADHLGLTIETVSRVFGQFKRQGLTELRGPKTVILKNMPALYDLAGFEDFPERHMAMGL
jgi:CRP/FNR family transcriptional regulator